MATSVVQHGITFTFGGDYPVGEYITGDSVVAPGAGRTITSITPNYIDTSGSERNGFEVNPGITGQAFDARAADFEVGRVGSLPLDISTAQVVVKAISVGEFVGTPDENYDSLGRSEIETVSVLTVGTIPASPADTFRPPYLGAAGLPEVTYADVNWAALPGLSTSATMPVLADLIRRWERVQYNPLQNPGAQSIRPRQHMAAYGNVNVKAADDAIARLLISDASEATIKPLRVGIFQAGWDEIGIINAGQTRTVNGGHNHGQKILAVLAATLLGDTDIINMVRGWSL